MHVLLPYPPVRKLLALLLIVVVAGCDGTSEDEDRSYTSTRVSYTASVLGGVERPLTIAMPSDYNDRSDRLPVLYLLHGWGGSEGDWVRNGNVVETLTAGYADGTVRPMLVVMPNNVFDGADPLAGGPDRDVFLREIREDIIPYIEANYRVATSRNGRAIAGLSAGGIQTLNLTLFFPELWSYAYPMSTSYFAADMTMLRNDHGDALRNGAINELVEFELAIAPDDFLFYELYQSLKVLLSDHGISFTTYEAPGGHTWGFWSRYFEEIAPRVFQ